MANLIFDKAQIETAIDKIVDRTMRMDMTWDWPCGVAYYGICEAYEVTKNERYLQLVKDRVDEYIELGLPVADAPAWTPAPPFAPLTPPKDCALPAPDTDPFADYDATRPQEVLTRAEALELAIKALKLFPINVYNDLYADIVGHETYAGTVQCAAQNDLIPAAWIADGRLYPQRTVTAADFLAVLMPGAAGRRPLAAPSPLPDSVPAYARFAAGQAVAEQLISADSLNDPITRSDAAALCRRLHI